MVHVNKRDGAATLKDFHPRDENHLPVVINISVNVGIGDLTQDEDLGSGRKCTCLRSLCPCLARLSSTDQRLSTCASE